MYYENSCARDLQIAYIGGGSRGWAWTFMTDLAMEQAMCGTLRLYDIDRESAEANKVIGQRIAADPRAVSRWSYTVESSLEAALTGADFVIISILPGTFDEMAYDVHLPERLGIYQSVGDTAGPGGLMRALRTLPMIAEIGEAVKRYAPEAWVLNFTNPMTTCIRTLYTVFPGIKAMGCCHEVFGTQKLLAAMLEDMAGIPDVPRQEIRTGVTGINHFTWLYSASYQGLDLMPMYRRFVEKYMDEGFARGADANWMNNSFNCNHRVKFDLFRRYGLIAAAGDRHLVEFLPGWYLRDPETVRSWGFGLTTVDFRKTKQQDRIARQKRLVSGEEAPDLTSSGEEGCLLMKALLGLGDMVSNVNLPNRGQIPGLPMDAVVETNALFRKNEISPVLTPPLPQGLDALIGHQVAIQEATVTAALTCDYPLALNTFLADPQMCRVPLEEGSKLFKDMLAGTAAYLPDGWQKYI